MTSLMSKVGLYDLLSMVLPGYLVGFLVCRILMPDIPLPNNDMTYWVAGFCISYLLGIIVHRISRCLFFWLNHNEWLSLKALDRFNHDCKKRKMRAETNGLEASQEKHYQIYFTHLTNGDYPYIDALEAQLSFTRSLTLVGLLYSLFGCFIVDSPCWIGFFVLCTLISLWITVSTRLKIHYYYYELNHYGKK